MLGSVPGPGQYELKSVIGREGQKKSFGLKYKWDVNEKESTLKPGPGAYEPKRNLIQRTAP
jgi:hypothetical protein